MGKFNDWKKIPWPRDNLPLWKQIFRVIGRVSMILFFTLIFLGGIAGIILIWDMITLSGQYYDFFYMYLPVKTIVLIVGVFIFGIGGYGLFHSIALLIDYFKKKPHQVKKGPKIAALALLTLGIITVNYYIPFLGVSLGLSEPEFGPYISYHGEDGMVISWDTKRNESSILYWGDNDQDVSNLAEGCEFSWNLETETTSKHHSVVLDGLAPDKDFYYKIPGLGSKIYKFHTSPLPGSGKSVTFTITGDTQGGYNIQKRNVDLMFDDPDGLNFTVIVGDLTNRDDSLEEWAMLFDKNSYGRISPTIPWMNTPGNHEFSCIEPNCGFRESYRKYFQYEYPSGRIQLPDTPDYGMYYSYNYSNVHMVVLDNFENETYTKASGFTQGTFFTTEQLNWLKEDLARNTDNWKFVMFHVPMYSMGDYGSNAEICNQLEPILDLYGVDAVFYGHDHHFESFLVNSTLPHNGIYHFVVGGGGGGIDPLQDESRYGSRAWDSLSINRSINPTEFDNKFSELYGHEYELYGELTHHYMKVQVDGENAVFTAIRTFDESIIVQYSVER